MKLQRVYHKLENLHLYLKSLPGEDWRSLFVDKGPEYNKEASIVDVTFGFSYVADMKMHPYEGRYKDYDAAIDIYSNSKYVMGISILNIPFLKDMLSLKTDTYECGFKGGYREGAKRISQGRFYVSIKEKDNYWHKYDSHITFRFNHQRGYELILCPDKEELPLLIDAFSACERELNKFISI